MERKLIEYNVLTTEPNLAAAILKVTKVDENRSFITIFLH